MWQHVVSGGRVGLCFFDAAQWAWREAGKEGGAGSSTASAVGELFRQMRALRPTSVALPPNVWAVADRCFRPPARRRVGGLASGGAPTPARDWAFAQKLARHLGCGLSDSYGATEAGALASGGRQADGDKFGSVEVRLVDFRPSGSGAGSGRDPQAATQATRSAL